jgi:hypothetical protein
MKKYCVESRRRRGISYIKQEEVSLTGLLRNCLLNTLLKEIWKGRQDEEEEVSSYCMNLTKRGDTGSCKRKH